MQEDALEKELQHLGETLSELRADAKLTIRGLAKNLGVPPTTIWRIEKGEIKRRPSTELLNDIAVGLGEYGEEFRERAGILRPELQEILSRSKGSALTLERLHGKFVEMLADRDLSDREIESVMAQVTEQTIADVISGVEQLDIAHSTLPEEEITKRLADGEQVIGLEQDISLMSKRPTASSGSEYLDKNKAAFGGTTQATKEPDALAAFLGSPKPLPNIEAGDATIVLKRPISEQELTSLEAIARVISELLKKI